MYLIGIKEGKSFCGNRGTLITHYKQASKISLTASLFANMHNHDAVYKLNIYSQSLCELSPTDFATYVVNNCIRVY